ncbi:putative elongation factor EFG, domain V, EF-G domain III/V [Helianthus anomalus]
MVGPPKVINKKVDDKVLKPYEIATVEVPEEHMGAVVELLGKRRGQMFDMQGVGYAHKSSLNFQRNYSQWRSLTMKMGGGGGAKTYIPKNFYRTRGSKTYIPKNFYTKTTYITPLSEKFGGSGAPPDPLKLRQ